MMKKVFYKTSKSHCTQSAGTVGSVRRSGRYRPWVTERWVRVWVQDARSRFVCGCERRVYVNAGPGDIDR